MSKRGYISRYLLIIKKLRARPYTSFDELAAFLQSQEEIYKERDGEWQLGFSKRTFQRDIREIRLLFGLEIEYARAEGGYIIREQEPDRSYNQRVLEEFELFNILTRSAEFRPYIIFEEHALAGLENFHGLLHAIQNRVEIQFMYEKFWDGDRRRRTVQPHALKEFRSRWYLLATDSEDEKLKSFALDRLTELEITRRNGKGRDARELEQLYSHCFGIMVPEVEKPEEVVLSFDPFQGKYVKSLPLHRSQEILLDNEEELRVRLRVFITQDFIMELLSLGDEVQVLQPSSLAQEIRAAHEAAVRQYDIMD